jgi:SAM-dependent methyltransferase
MADKPTSDLWWRGPEIHGCESWEDGELLFEFAKAHGLLPEHHMLEIGCGALRAGRHFIRYLEPGHYVGLDHSAHVLSAARREVELEGLKDQCPVLIESSDFDLSTVPPDVWFDFAWSHSVMTHMTPDQVEACLRSVFGKLAERGVYYSTYNEADTGKHAGGGPHPWREGELHGSRFPAAFFVRLARRLGLAVEFVCATYLAEYTKRGRNTEQFVLRFRRQRHNAMETGPQ